MKLWEIIQNEFGLFKNVVVSDPYQERTWSCEPLLVIDEDDEVAFLGNTEVQVKPRGTHTADLVAAGDKDGWHPSLIAASVEVVTLKGTTAIAGRPGEFRGGLCCKGIDAEGIAFTWYINGAAEDYAFWNLNGFDASSLPEEQPVET